MNFFLSFIINKNSKKPLILKSWLHIYKEESQEIQKRITLLIAFEIWRAPLMQETEDGRLITKRPTKKLSDLFKKNNKIEDNKIDNLIFILKDIVKLI